MTEEDTTQADRLLADTVDIVSAYVSNNAITVADLPKLIRDVHGALAGLAGVVAAPVEPAVEIRKPSPAEIKKSITPDALISFIDGRPYKTLKRHLGTHGLDPNGYRQRYGLSADYPMTSPNYSAQRTALAKSIGLGRGGVPDAT